MNDMSLIKKIEYTKDLGKIFPVTFEIGNYFDREDLKSIFSLITDENLLASERISIASDSFTIPVTLDTIPKITSILLENHIDFYGIYVLYDKYLEMKEVDKNE